MMTMMIRMRSEWDQPVWNINQNLASKQMGGEGVVEVPDGELVIIIIIITMIIIMIILHDNQPNINHGHLTKIPWDSNNNKWRWRQAVKTSQSHSLGTKGPAKVNRYSMQPHIYDNIIAINVTIIAIIAASPMLANRSNEKSPLECEGKNIFKRFWCRTYLSKNNCDIIFWSNCQQSTIIPNKCKMNR